ncbi:hypothetical protein QJS10_CPA03g00569 [Acorus calamus]|uniref:G domain-containing protein n=1 Tax=Acorus calamus TaxID=4465 RepID=A0AAV9FAB9_ACOCL|nr:hypothetical protein QJS10_CPA03g00569 [Acorus calamus]
MGGGNPSKTVASEGDKEDNDDGYVEVSDPDSSSTVHESRGPEQARRDRAHDEILQLYSSMQVRIGTRAVAKDRIRRYKPGDWIEGVGGTARSDYEIPDTTTLLIVGPEGSGKSSLVNRISGAFEDDASAPDRAQVAYNWSVGMGTHYFKEYMIPRGSSAFCVYDTRGLSNDRSENLGLIKKWMTEGVRHGDLDLRSSDLSGEMRVRKTATQIGGHYRKRAVNFVIFVVDMTSVLKSMDARDKCYTDFVANAFGSPFLSFKDDKPVIVLTHGDELSRFDRARVRIHLGELLGVPPTKQFFEIPDDAVEAIGQSTEY